jgi:hypothetical protein
MLRVGGDNSQGFGGGSEENTIDDLLVLIGNRGDLLRHRKDDVKIGYLQKLGLAVLDPLCAGQALAFRAMPIPTGVEAIALMATLITAFEVAAEGGGPAHLDRGHDAPLRRGHRRAMFLSMSFAVSAEDIRHLPLWALHGLDAQKC